jgi:DNA-binding response OmpR family regulator
LCRRIRVDLKSSVPILMLTARDTLEDKETGFTGGADDYLTKPFDLRELELRIGAISRRGFTLNSELKAGNVYYNPGTLKVRTAAGCSLTLSGIGASLFEILMRAYPNYVKHQTLIEAVWQDEDVDPHTLRSHISALRKSLKTGLGFSCIQSVHGKGYCLDVETG